MTTHGDEPELGGPIDRELTRRHEAFTAAVEAALDVEAGLRDILFQSRHEAFTAKVETALDVEAGLRDILTPPAIQAPPSLPPAVAPLAVSAAPGGSRWQASPAQRLKLRSNPRVAAASRVLRFVGNWASASPRSRSLVRALVRARGDAFARARARQLVSELDRALDLAGARDLARVLARDRDRDLDPDRHLDLARVLARALILTCNLARDPDHVRGLDSALARELDSILDHDLVRALDLARVRARDLALDLAHALARNVDRARCRCLEIISSEYAQVVGAPVAVDEESLGSLMDDFTTDDLSGADVREDDIKLTGVRWSDGTTWPASTDIDRLKRRSDRQEDGSWIIHDGTGNVRNNVLT